MKNIIALFTLLAALTVGAQSNIVGCVRLVWTDNNSPDVTADPTYHWNLYHGTNMTIPLTNWVKIATSQSGVTNIPINIPGGTHFFYVTCQNWWEESPPSNVAGTNTPTNLLAVTLRITSLSRTNAP